MIADLKIRCDLRGSRTSLDRMKVILRTLHCAAQALIRKYMPIGVIIAVFLFVIWARWFFYGRR